MNQFFSNGFFPLFTILAFVAIVLLLEGLYLLWNSYKGPEAKKVEQRLRSLSASSDHTEHSAVLKNRMLSEVPLIERLLLSVPRISHLDRFIEQSGVNWTAGKLLGISLLCGVLAYAGLTSARLFSTATPIIAIVVGLLPFGYVSLKRSKRIGKIEQQLPDTLDLIGRAMRAGHALPSALQMVGNEMVEPIANEFRITHDEINFGISMQQALLNLSTRVPLSDLRYFVVAILIQREAGGNLTEVLDNLSKLIRERLKFRSKIRVLSAEGRMSAWVLGLLPFGLVGLLNLINPKFISVLWTDPAGIKISKMLILTMTIGAFWLYRLTKIRV